MTISTTHARHTTQRKLAEVNRFIQQFERGHGDYTAERDRLLGNPTVDELMKDIKRHRAAKEGAPPLKRPRVASGKTKTTGKKQQASTTH